MATKVKGDKIKEGSIPLSALSSAVRNKIENAGGGADWNALAGKSGYINNKPIFINYSNNDTIGIHINEDSNENFEDIHDDDGYIIGIKSKPLYNYFSSDRIYGFYIKSPSYPQYEEYKILSVNDSIYNNKSITISSDNNDRYIYTLYFKEEYFEELDNTAIILYIMFNKNNYDYEDLICGEYDYFTIKTLPEFYIPDTVLKTTPQTLSDADKNQVLANLGIDPVVWKYMYNPYELSDYGGMVPEELRNIIEDENGYLRKIALKLIVIKNTDGDVYNLINMGYESIYSERGRLLYSNGYFEQEP